MKSPLHPHSCPCPGVPLGLHPPSSYFSCKHLFFHLTLYLGSLDVTSTLCPSVPLSVLLHLRLSVTWGCWEVGALCCRASAHHSFIPLVTGNWQSLPLSNPLSTLTYHDLRAVALILFPSMHNIDAIYFSVPRGQHRVS